MINKLSQSIAYLCPSCSDIHEHAINIFNFSGKKTLEIPCSFDECDETALTICECHDNYRVNVKCPYCDNMHVFTIKKSTFWSRDILTFNCPISDMNVFSVGNKDKIEEIVNELENSLSEISESFIADNKTAILLDMLYKLDELMSEEKIFCECGSHEIGADTDEDNIVLVCSKCGAVKFIPISQSETDKLDEIKEIKLKK